MSNKQISKLNYKSTFKPSALRFAIYDIR